MTFTAEQVEEIVLEVLRRLGVAAGEQRRIAVVERSSTTAELRLTDKIVTLRTLEGRLDGVSRVVVAPRAVVTPAVRDELKQRKIQLAFMAGETPAPRT